VKTPALIVGGENDTTAPPSSHALELPILKVQRLSVVVDTEPAIARGTKRSQPAQ
jgi:hypothetical protein